MSIVATSVWRDLVTAVLAVYNYSLEKVDGYAPGLEEQGLFEPQHLASLSHEALFNRLEAAGYTIGNLNGIFVERLLGLGTAIRSQGAKNMETVLESSEVDAITAMLRPVRGVGPKVIENYLRLRRLVD